MSSKYATIGFAVLLIACSLVSVQTGTIKAEAVASDDGKRVVESMEGIHYSVGLESESSTLSIGIKNPTNKKIKFTRYVISVDGQRVHEQNLNLSSGERRIKKINITPGINVNQDSHTVTFSTFGGHTQFNFTRKIDSSAPGKIPTPYIADVKVTEGTIAGEPSAVAKVTLVNPSDQLYGTKLMVHTVGTDGSLYPASVRPGNTRTITVELLDERGAKIAGEARLYTGNMTTADGAIDQVEFAGHAGAGTQVWNTSYEPVRPTWMNHHYKYHNDSYRRSFGEKLSGGHELADIPIAYLGAGLLLALFAVGKLR